MWHNGVYPEVQRLASLWHHVVLPGTTIIHTVAWRQRAKFRFVMPVILQRTYKTAISIITESSKSSLHAGRNQSTPPPLFLVTVSQHFEWASQPGQFQTTCSALTCDNVVPVNIYILWFSSFFMMTAVWVTAHTGASRGFPFTKSWFGELV